MKKNIDYSRSFLDYLDYMEKPGGNKKFVIVVSRNQYAIEIDNSITHDNMYADLVSNIRPDVRIDNHGNAINEEEKFTNDMAIILGEPGYISFQLPDNGLTEEQFKCIKEILGYINNYNRNAKLEGNNKNFIVFAYSNSNNLIKAADYQDNIEDLIAKMKENIDDNIEIKPEVIIGKEFEKVKQKNYESYADYLLTQMEEGKIDTNGNPLLGPDSDLRFKKGNVNMLLIGTLTAIISIGILVLGSYFLTR